MKNVHLIPTENYSLLVYSTSRYGRLFLSKYYSPMKEMGDSYQNIYITSLEEIKEGDWILFKIDDVTEIVKVTTIVNNAFDSKEGFGYGLEYCKKIILTTDDQLIKDGVQAIDDEFLKWFVKNPSCEEVEVDTLPNLQSWNESTHKCNTIYEIIIPKGESDVDNWIKQNPQCKQVESCSKSLTKKCICPKEEHKQETLEEIKPPIGKFIIENAIATQGNDGSYYHYSEVCKLLKLQAERMYSEEELKSAFKVGFNIGYGSPVQELDLKNEHCERWFEQFKKK